MADQTVHAEALIQTVARAFYDDDAVCLIDVLIRDKYLRDDDMAPRLSLPNKKIRSTLQFLQEEHLVKFELVDDLRSGGSQATKFWYIDIHHAVNVIRYRIYLLKKGLDDAELRARSNSMYVCPGYPTKVCNGRYTETEAQQYVNPNTGHFYCRECYTNHRNNPEPPPESTYTLQLVDNAKDLKRAEENIRRVRVQLSAKMIGNSQLRAGIYDLLQKVRSKGGSNPQPLSSNLPSDNIEKGIGTKRLAGTGRTAGTKAKKNKLLEGATRTEEGSDMNYLKNYKGEEIGFEVEKGSGARANLLATKTRRRDKLMDAAATRVWAGIPILQAASATHKSSRLDHKRKPKAEASKDRRRNGTVLPGMPFFLMENIGDRYSHNYEEEMNRKRSLSRTDADRYHDDDDDKENDDLDSEEEELDGLDSERNVNDDERLAQFQARYRIEKTRQKALMFKEFPSLLTNGNDLNLDMDADADEDDQVPWEEG